jgi:hypothetical protein
VPREHSGRTVALRGEGCRLTASRHADPPLSFASSARENVVEGAAENDGVKLVIADCHLGGKIAFHEQRRLLVTRPRPAGDSNVGPNWSPRLRL